MASSPRRGLVLSILTIIGSAATRMAAKWFNRAAAAAGARPEFSSRLRSAAPVATYHKLGGYNGKHRRLTSIGRGGSRKIRALAQASPVDNFE
jgi:hypothetical protein